MHALLIGYKNNNIDIRQTEGGNNSLIGNMDYRSTDGRRQFYCLTYWPCLLPDILQSSKHWIFVTRFSSKQAHRNLETK
jgi:hypothetical protein